MYIATNTTNLLKSIFKVLFYEEINNPVYEYTFFINGQEIKADICYTKPFNKTYCIINDEKYTNVSYTEKYIKTELINNPFYPMGQILIFTIIFCYIINILFYKLSRKENDK